MKIHETLWHTNRFEIVKTSINQGDKSVSIPKFFHNTVANWMDIYGVKYKATVLYIIYLK